MLFMVLEPVIRGQDTEQFRISVNLDLVLLHASVRDGGGRFASGLREENIAVSEDGVRQSIRLFRDEDTPVTVGLVVDHSGSMGRKLDDVISAARAFVGFSNPLDEMFVVNFNENVELGLPGFTNSSEILERAILKDPALGMTALYDAIALGMERLQAGTREKKVLIVISDGGDTASRRKLADILLLARQSSTIIYTIGIFDPLDPDKNPSVLNRLAEATGGEAFLPGKVSLTEACERIARDIRHQYTIGYVSTNSAKPGTYRIIKMTASKPGLGRLSVRTRAGYIAR
jgi:VWFA-related protein